MAPPEDDQLRVDIPWPVDDLVGERARGRRSPWSRGHRSTGGSFTPRSGRPQSSPPAAAAGEVNLSELSGRIEGLAESTLEGYALIVDRLAEQGRLLQQLSARLDTLESWQQEPGGHLAPPAKRRRSQLKSPPGGTDGAATRSVRRSKGVA